MRSIMEISPTANNFMSIKVEQFEAFVILKIYFSEDWARKLKITLRKIQKDKNIRAVILEFTDEEKFSFNVKIKDLNEKYLIHFLENFCLPTILIVKNSISGFLFEIVLASHICVASNSAVFELSKKQSLKKQMGSKKLHKLETIENKINAETAFDLGIVNKLTEVDNLKKEAFGMAETISKFAPSAIKSCLKAVNEGLQTDLNSGLELETELFSQIFATEDMREGTSAFLEKRKPVFNGN